MIVREQRTWPELLFSMRGSILPRIWVPLVSTTGLAVVVTVLYKQLDLDKKFSLTTVPFSLIAVALAIFLGFRNNACYDRHWEGRKLWGQLVNTSRSLARQFSTLVAPAVREGSASESEARAVEDFRREMVRRVIAYVHALRLHLRDQAVAAEIAPFLPAGEVASLEAEKNVPIALLAGIARRLQVARRKGWLSEYHVPVLEAGLAEFTSVQGGCERIKNSPLPFAYTLLIHRIAGFYCFMLPFGIVDQVGFMTPLVTLLISYAFFGLDAIGDEIQDPFGTDPNDLPLSAISRTIEINLRQGLGERDLPPSVEPVDGVLG